MTTPPNAVDAKGGLMAIRLRSATSAPVNAKLKITRSTPMSSLTRMTQAFAAGMMLVVVCASSGCSITSGACRMIKHSDCIDDFMIKYRNSVLAAKAWHAEKHCFQNHCHLRDLQAGYMAGFSDVASGSDGCVPSIAPSSYWGWRHQTADGQNAVNAWFQGYPLGVRAAEKAGIAHWGEIRPMSANLPAQQPPVYVPPPSRTTADDQENNPFYSREQYVPPPYEPVEGDQDGSEDPDDDTDTEDDNADDGDDVNAPIRDALEEGLDDLDDGPMERDASPLEPPTDVRDAIRDALEDRTNKEEAGDALDAVKEALDDSASRGMPFNPQAAATVRDTTSFSMSDRTPGTVEQVYRGTPAGRSAETIAAPVRELPFTFE